MANISLFDLAIVNRADSYTGLVEDVTTLPKEFSTIPSRKINGTWYEIAKRVQLPTAQCRNANAGVSTSKSGYKKEVKQMFLVDVQLQMDEAIVKADPSSIGSMWQHEAEGAMKSGAILIGQQTYYGTSADASGFTGVRDQLAYSIDAGGSSSSTSAYLLRLHEKDGCRYDVGNDGQFVKFAAALGHPEWPSDARFVRNQDRVVNREAIDGLIIEALKTFNADALIDTLTAAGIPCGRINSVAQALSAPHTVARKMVETIQHPTSGDVKVLGMPFRFSGTPPSIRRAPPTLGQHTSEVLGDDLGLTAEQIAELRAQKVI